VSRWVGEAVEARGEEKWANASSQNQSAVFFSSTLFLLGFYSELRFVIFI
jgi:hypothetical protein